MKKSIGRKKSIKKVSNEKKYEKKYIILIRFGPLFAYEYNKIMFIWVNQIQKMNTFKHRLQKYIFFSYTQNHTKYFHNILFAVDIAPSSKAPGPEKKTDSQNMSLYI